MKWGNNMILPKHHLQSANVVSDLIHESQFQPAGVDLTLKIACKFKTAGKIDFDNKERKVSDCEDLAFNSDEVHLPKGCYKAVFNEYVKIPSDAAALCYTRSSLLRSGASLQCAVWDPGYEGRSEALLVVHNEHGLILKKNAKIGQLIFIKLVEPAKSLYQGVYKGENK